MEKIKNFNRQEITMFINENGFKNTSIAAETDKWLIVKCMDVEELYKLFGSGRNIAFWAFLHSSKYIRDKYFEQYVHRKKYNQYVAFSKIDNSRERLEKNIKSESNQDKNLVIGITVKTNMARNYEWGDSRIVSMYNRLNEEMLVVSYSNNELEVRELNDIVEKFNL